MEDQRFRHAVGFPQPDPACLEVFEKRQVHVAQDCLEVLKPRAGDASQGDDQRHRLRAVKVVLVFVNGDDEGGQ